MKKYLPILLSAIFIIVGALIIFFSQPQIKKESGQPAVKVDSAKTLAAATSSAQSLQTVKVTRVIDGDSIEIEGGQKVRYIGMDTPETVDPRKPVQCYGQEASAKNKELVGGKSVRLEKDVSETDKYGRLLRFVYVGDIFVNDYLIRKGFAHASTFPPDVKYQDKFQASQRLAQSDSIGLWLGCGSAQTSVPTQTLQSPSAGCLIKGNISSNGEKIYHMPGQQFYDKTIIDSSKGEMWFCTEQEAVSAGWRKSKT